MSRRLIGFAAMGALMPELHNFPGAPGGPGGFPGAPMTGGGAMPAAPGVPGAPVAPVQAGMMDTAARPSVGGDWPEGDLPQQMGGTYHILYPGVSTFVLPANLAQCWKWGKYKDNNPRSRTFGQEVDRIYLDFDKSSPLIIVQGRPEDMGQPLTAEITANPRARGKKDNPATPYVSDLAYLFEISLGDKSRPTDNDPIQAQLKLAAAINQYAGQKVRLEHGFSGYCSQNKVKRVVLGLNADQTPLFGDDPTGAKGCGEGYYTNDFKNPQPGGATPAHLYFKEIYCKKQVGVNGQVPILCNAVVRGWPQIERFLPPLGQ